VPERGFDVTAALDLVDALDGRTVLVVGDVMLDRYWWGTVTRLSPEAPVPVVHKQRSSVAPGGAANVAANVASLGGRPRLVGVIGDDEAGRELVAELGRRGIEPDHLVVEARRSTTVKTRVVAVSQHVVRVDEEDRHPVEGASSTQLGERVAALLDGVSVVVLSDYAKGVLTPALIARAIRDAHGRGARVVVDPKGHDYTRYRGASLLCPNRMEALAAAGIAADERDAVGRAGAMLLETVSADGVLITLGEEGMRLFERGRRAAAIPAVARAVYDVTGAGDTVMAVLALTLAAGADLEMAVRLANLAAGLAVEQVGTTAVTAAQLRDALRALDTGQPATGVLPGA
jgi:D-beta-D-heptose 7-phosphate kinase/D-beta-D-heptose 1-phosphate adenosyltransferase